MIADALVATIPALGAIVGLISVAGYAVRRGWLRHPVAPSSDRLALVQTVALDTRRRLHLVRCNGRHVLLLTGGPQDIHVGWIPPDEVGGQVSNP